MSLCFFCLWSIIEGWVGEGVVAFCAYKEKNHPCLFSFRLILIEDGTGTEENDQRHDGKASDNKLTHSSFPHRGQGMLE